jgi:hemerythrin-like domain-containing protein
MSRHRTHDPDREAATIDVPRRSLVATGLLAATAGMAGALAGCAGRREEDEAEEVSPAEDLMREHGVLDRVLLIYEEGIRRLQSAPADLPPDAILGAAGIVRRFIEDYHERLEETHLFPRFEKARRLADLVAVLRTQHQSGRRLTDEIVHLLGDRGIADEAGRASVAGGLARFIRMYRPHAAREDTVLFPALHALVTPHEYGALGEEFEDEEHRLFGGDGFEKIVKEVEGLERRLGIDDLARFTA